MQGTRIGYENNQIVVPDDPIIPYIEGDGTGPDIWRATQHVIDGTLAKVYGSKKKMHWFEVLPRGHRGPALHAGRRRHPLAERDAAPGPRPLRVRAPGALLRRRAVTGQ